MGIFPYIIRRDRGNKVTNKKLMRMLTIFSNVLEEMIVEEGFQPLRQI